MQVYTIQYGEFGHGTRGIAYRYSCRIQMLLGTCTVLHPTKRFPCAARSWRRDQSRALQSRRRSLRRAGIDELGRRALDSAVLLFVVSVVALPAAKQAALAGSEAGSVVPPGSVDAAGAFLDHLASVDRLTADARQASPAAPSPP